MSTLDIDAVRDMFPTLGDPLWLNHGGGAPVPRAVSDAVCRVAQLSCEASPLVWVQAYVQDRDELRAALGRMIGSPPEQIALTRSTAHGLSLVARGLDWRAGDNVVSARWEFPSNLYPWMALERQGVALRLVEPVEGRVRPVDVLARIDDRTRVVAVSFVQFWNGFRVDLAAIGAACRERGVLLVVDGIQGIGAVRLDVEAAHIDVLAAGAVKWLLGPVGIGFCYVRPEIVDRLQPATVGLGSMSRPELIFDPELDFSPTARRFEESASSWYAIAGFLASVNLLESVGHDVVEQRVLANVRELAAGLEDLGYELVEPWPRQAAESSGLVAARHRHRSVEADLALLEAAGVFARVYQDFLRFSPHFYNTDEDLDRALSALDLSDHRRRRAGG